ncbi:MAG: Gfo/Idh/MocA family oxidoreductase, partial [Acetivibrio sp.]
EKNGASLIFDNLDKLALCTEVDAVYIASPTCFHYRQSLLMLRSGKHVLCEKPITTNCHELELLLRISEEKQVIFLEAIRNVFTPGYAMIQENIKRIGKIRRATLVYCQYSSKYDKFKEGKIENAFRPKLSNGAVMDIGVYGVYMLASLFGVPYSILAKGYILPDSIDASGVIVGKYKDMQAEVIYSKITDSYMPSEIQGEEGSIIFLPLAAPEKIKVIFRDGRKENYKVDLIKPDMYYEIEAFLDMIEGKRTDTKKWNDNSYASMKILDDARKQMDIVFPSDF